MTPAWLVELGRIEYGDAYELQRFLANERDAERVPDLLLLVEHPPVITLGRRGGREHIYADAAELELLGISVYETNRGGLVTYHGPGQLVGYPIGRLRALAGDPRTYVWRIEETLIRTLAELGIEAWRHPEHRGVFAVGGKIAAIGVAVTRGVTMHGFALNLTPDLSHFALINPCGLGDIGVTSAERLLGQAVDGAAVRASLAFHVGREFGRAVEPAPAEFWQTLRERGIVGDGAPLYTGGRAGEYTNLLRR